MPNIAHRALCPFIALAVTSAALSLAFAEGVAGSFIGDSPAGRVELHLETWGQRLHGTLEAPGVRLELQGELTDDGAFGLATDGTDTISFEAYLDRDRLGLYLFSVDAFGSVDMDSVVELLLERSRPAPPFGGATPGVPDAPSAANPLAPGAQPDLGSFVGTFSDGSLALDLRREGEAYVGVARLDANRYPLQARARDDVLEGFFESDGHRFTFVARLADDTLHFDTGGASYALRRDPASVTAAEPAPANPLVAAPPANASPAVTPVLARAAGLELALDDALAFLEALEFVLAELGYPYRFTAAEREAALAELARTFPLAERSDQVVLAQARTIWERVQTNWQRSTERERREFALGVLVLAFGEDTVAEWVGPAGTGGQGQDLGAGRGCTSFDDCAASFVDQQTWTDTFNAQGCWSAAGCESYDTGSGTFTFNEDW